MSTAPYSGAAVRGAHYAVRPSVRGIDPEHEHNTPDPDMFQPQPATPTDQAGTVWAQDAPFHSDFSEPSLAQVPVHHWAGGQLPVPSGEPYGRAQQALQERFLADHAVHNFVPDTARIYRHHGEGTQYQWVEGRRSQFDGAVIPDGPLAALQNGTNAYDAVNPVTEMYSSGGDSNVGRYRLGMLTQQWGIYEMPLAKNGQDAYVRPLPALTPAVPVDKPQMRGTSPHTPNSTGTAHWAPAAPFQVPSMFALPSESVMTDYAAVGDSSSAGSEFTDRDRL